ncbi:hypothetical protein FRC00_013606, partial [Tulasnella sp. 408]
LDKNAVGTEGLHHLNVDVTVDLAQAIMGEDPRRTGVTRAIVLRQETGGGEMDLRHIGVVVEEGEGEVIGTVIETEKIVVGEEGEGGDQAPCLSPDVEQPLYVAVVVV